MIRRIETERDCCIYRLKQGDTLESVARMFKISVQDIMHSNPLFSSVYPGCAVFIEGVDRKRVVVEPMQTLADIARDNDTTVEEIISLNKLNSEKVFVGMQLFVKGKNNEENIV